MATGLSINIGLNHVDPAHYDGWDGELFACEFDARDMHELARQHGLDGRLILANDATSSAVTGAIADAAGKLSTGDLLFLTYSGHGGQVPDLGGDDEDRKDETWVLFDRQLLDDELYSLWASFQPGVRIFMLSDSCHSGSVMRAVAQQLKALAAERGAPTRELPPDIQARTIRAHKEQYRAIQQAHPRGDRADVGAHVLLISGCRDDQLSLDGVANGLFTETLLAVWEQGAFQDYRTLHEQIAQRMPPDQTPQLSMVGAPSSGFEAQRPLSI